MYERLLTARRGGGARSVLLLGPRQVGKSTRLAGLHPDWTINVADPATFRDYLTEPQRFGRELESAKRATRLILVDEIQRAPSIPDPIQVAIDRAPRRFRFLLSGSSARKLRRGQANLLPGRVDVHYMHPLLAPGRGG